MRKRKARRRYGAALIAALIVSAMVLPKAYAANAIDIDKTDCKIEVDIQDSGNVELNTLPVTVNFYKVADVDVAGKYMVVSALQSSDLSFAEFNSEETDSETIDNDYWKEKSAIAKAAVDAAVEAGTMTVTASCVTTSGRGLVENLPVGLYLVDAQQAESTQYTYNFTPYLISMPNNYYKTGGADAWVYEYVIGLKAQRGDRYGDLRITKELDVYNETVGGANFVFQIEATKTDVDTEETEVVYSDVVYMTFTKPGTESIVVENIPAGAEVVVTEIYTGSSYKLVSDPSVTVIIVGNDDTDTDDETQEVTFKNTYDERLNGGYGIVNEYSYDSETKTWTNNQNPTWEKDVGPELTP